jgi:hypothetical protein
MSLPEVIQYRDAAKSVAEKLAGELTTYATLNGDMEFKRMTPKMQLSADKRIKIINIIEKLDNIIENKVLTLFD